jgi:hypothetical protein
MLLTLTVPHDYGEPLVKVTQDVRAAFGSLVAGRAWQDDKAAFSLAHYVRAHDCTVGPHGWHFHVHVVLLGRTVLQLGEVDALANSLYTRWSRLVKQMGRRPPSRAHGLQLEQARSEAAVSDYVFQVVSGEGPRCKPVALEVARGDLKASRHPDHRTPWEVLADFSETGDLADLALWHEWEAATAGVHAIRWSKGLRQEIGLAAEKTDEEIVQVEVGGEVIYTFSFAEWTAVCATRGAQGRILVAAEEGGTLGVVRYLRSVFPSRIATPLPSVGAG